MSNPKVAIVIVTWNKRKYVLNLLKSLGILNYDNYEIIVVDNASTDNTVDSIRELYPGINLIENEYNLGGTGGFNTGINHVLSSNNGFDYLWLLDNDADIEKNTLSEIIDVMEKDSSIGLAGSRIVDPEDKNITVELGANFRWDTIDVVPFNRNTKTASNNLVANVDYVAVCSAVAKVEALKEVGPMDERHFLFWDDMDWGLYFKENGYKVVAVNNSITYHPSFTERRRGKLTDYYYGIRNPLLVYSKHTKILQRTKIFFRYFRRLLKIILLLRFTNCKNESNLAIQAIKDFSNNKWGKYELSFQDEFKSNSDTNQLKKSSENEILIIADDIFDNIIMLQSLIEQTIPNARITLMVNSDRKELFDEQFSSLIVVDSNKNTNFLYNFRLFLKIYFTNYDSVICIYSNPFTFAVKKSYFFIPEKNTIEISNNSRTNIFVPIFSTILGELGALFITPYLLIKSLRY